MRAPPARPQLLHSKVADRLLDSSVTTRTENTPRPGSPFCALHCDNKPRVRARARCAPSRSQPLRGAHPLLVRPISPISVHRVADAPLVRIRIDIYRVADAPLVRIRIDIYRVADAPLVRIRIDIYRVADAPLVRIRIDMLVLPYCPSKGRRRPHRESN